jgi:phospholipid/cholesterol/gamma-HCH transport system substrate-binding protein
MKKKNNEVAVGIFVIVGFIFLTLVLFFVSKVYSFRSGYSLDVMFETVSILDRGAPVRMAGVRVGEVSRVNLVYDETKQKSRVKVKLFIAKGVEIRENYEFSVRGAHILSEPHIEITPKVGNFPLVGNGALVEGATLVEMEDLFSQARDSLKNVTSMTGDLSQSLKGPDGDIYKGLKNMESSTASLSNVLGKVEKGNGTIGKLVMEDELYQEMDAFVKDVRAHPWKLLKKDSSDKRKWYFLFLA